MAHANASLGPWFTHPRMRPKWLGLAATLALTMLFWHPWNPLAILVGFLWFFPNEYVVHRWVYHRYAVGPDPPGPARSHIRHHVDPTDLDYIFNDPKFSVTVGIVFVGLAWLVVRDWGLAGAFSFGNFVGLVYYEYVHFTAHRPGVTPWMVWLRPLKRMHLWHHYKHEDHWFGVTTKVFDRALGSYADPHATSKSETVRSLQPPERLQDWIDGR